MVGKEFFMIMRIDDYFKPFASPGIHSTPSFILPLITFVAVEALTSNHLLSLPSCPALLVIVL